MPKEAAWEIFNENASESISQEITKLYEVAQ